MKCGSLATFSRLKTSPCHSAISESNLELLLWFLQLFISLLLLLFLNSFLRSSSICHFHLHPLTPFLGFSGSYCLNGKIEKSHLSLLRSLTEHIVKLSLCPSKRKRENEESKNKFPKREYS